MITFKTIFATINIHMRVLTINTLTSFLTLKSTIKNCNLSSMISTNWNCLLTFTDRNQSISINNHFCTILSTKKPVTTLRGSFQFFAIKINLYINCAVRRNFIISINIFGKNQILTTFKRSNCARKIIYFSVFLIRESIIGDNTFGFVLFGVFKIYSRICCFVIKTPPLLRK